MRKERIVINIIYDIDNNDLRLVSFNPSQSYQLEELVFYIPKQLKNMTPFLLIKDKNSKKDILKLTQISTDRNYIIYSVSLENKITVSEGASAITLMLLEENLFKTVSSSIILEYNNFTLAKQVNLIEDLSKQIIIAYKKIEELTKMNIEIYKSIEEVVK